MKMYHKKCCEDQTKGLGVRKSIDRIWKQRLCPALSCLPCFFPQCFSKWTCGMRTMSKELEPCEMYSFNEQFYHPNTWGSPADCLLIRMTKYSKHSLLHYKLKTLQIIAPETEKTHHNKPLPSHIPTWNENSVHEAQFPTQSSTLLQHRINSSPQLE